MKIMACFLLIAAIIIIIYSVGSLQCTVQDRQIAASNTFTAFASTIWTQTTQADFNLGSLTQVDTTTIPNDVILAKNGNNYRGSGNLRSQVLNTGRQGSTMDLLIWNVTLPASTSISFDVRASNTSFSATSGSPAWVAVGSTSPVSAGLPKGQYMQWRANLATSNNARTPDLTDVQIWYH
jgi:hypothetical protein